MQHLRNPVTHQFHGSLGQASQYTYINRIASVRSKSHVLAAADVVSNAVHATETVLVANENAWNSFSKNVSGEWEGVTASFSPSGEVQLLPEHYVPQAFRDWGVELKDWQSQCSATTSSNPKQLVSVLRRLMPTVGCEADAIAFTEEATTTSSSSSSTADPADSDNKAASSNNILLVAEADGSYSIGPLVASAGDSRFQVEHCFMLPVTGSTSGTSNSSNSSSSNNKVRVKVVQKFRRNWALQGAYKLDEIDLHREKYDGPFTGELCSATFTHLQSTVTQEDLCQTDAKQPCHHLHACFYLAILGPAA